MYNKIHIIQKDIYTNIYAYIKNNSKVRGWL